VAAIIGMIASGIKFQKGGLINLAIAFAILDIVTRYFDMFFSTLDRSMFFIAGGIILVIAGAYAEKNRRRLIEGLST
jgi:uncharacterized membrane protein